MDAIKISKTDEKKIQKAIDSEIPLMISTYTIPHEVEVYINEVTTLFLKDLQVEYMAEYITYCIRELATNAKKANTKRIYFKEKNLNILDDNDYQEGMKNFKNDTLTNIEHYMKLQCDEGLYVKVFLHKIGNRIKIEIRNNSIMTFYEYRRVHDKVARAGQFTSVEEAFDQILDNSEGAGLGIVIMILMLRKIGMKEDCFKTYIENTETVTEFYVDIKEENLTQLSVASEELVQLIDDLPNFPESISNIIDQLDDEEISQKSIAAEIEKDENLAVNLLKLINLACYTKSEKCRNIEKALSIVGPDGIKKMLLAIGTIRTLTNQNEIASKTWTHSDKVAFYAYNLAKNIFKDDAAIVDSCYVCALLHDMGKIIFFGLNIQENFETFCERYNVPQKIFEQLASGVNHAEIGAMAVEKWIFPRQIIEGIRYHHNPKEAPAEYKTIASIVYLADMLCGIASNDIEFYQIDSEILEEFGLEDREALKLIIAKLEDSYQPQV